MTRHKFIGLPIQFFRDVFPPKLKRRVFTGSRSELTVKWHLKAFGYSFLHLGIGGLLSWAMGSGCRTTLLDVSLLVGVLPVIVALAGLAVVLLRRVWISGDADLV